MAVANPPGTLELIELIYEAAADASRWRVFLEAFVHALRATAGSLFIQAPRNAELSIVCWCGVPDEDVRLHAERYAAMDPWALAAAENPEGKVRCDFELVPRERMEASAAFREFYLPRDVIHGIGGTILAGSRKSAIGALRGAARGPFGETEKAILGSLMPHLRRAALLHGELASLRSQFATVTEHLDRYPQAFLLVDTDCRVLFANASARAIADRRDGLLVNAGIFAASSLHDNQFFRKLVRQAAVSRNGAVHRISIERPFPRTPYRLLIMRAEDSGAVPLGVSHPAAACLIVDTESDAAPDPSLIAELFGLTPAEAQVATTLVEGHSVEEIAAQTGVAAGTVRTHLKRILAKTATSRQGELIALILRSLPLVRL